MIKAVLFDFDGTLMNTPPVIIESWQHAARTLLGHELPMDVVIGSFGEPILVTIEKHFPGLDPQLVLRTYVHHSDESPGLRIEMFPGTRELVLGVKALGYKTAMVTTRVWARTPLHLYDFGMENEFDCMVSGENCTRHKPDPEPCNIALEKLGIAPEEAIMVGDTLFDIECAHNAGVRAVIVSWSLTATPEDIQKADFFLQKPEDLYDYLESLR